MDRDFRSNSLTEYLLLLFSDPPELCPLPKPPDQDGILFTSNNS